MNQSNVYPVWSGWETVRLIGRGSFGAVYEIERDVFGQTEKAALKVITIPQNDSDVEEMYSDGYDAESITSTFKSHLQNIVNEYSLMRKMNGSANVVNCDDVSYVQHDDGIGWDIFIKMELLTPLTQTLPEKIGEDLVMSVARDICRALVLCRKHEIVHRDIKPQNIFLSPNGDYKLGDFGIAKTVEKTSGGTKIGTYKYMAPEVYNNRPYGAAADIYSLGLVLYWLLNERRMPFLPLPPEKLGAGLEEDARMRRLNGELLPAPAHGSEKLKRIVLKACAYDPKDRYQSAADMLSDLEELGEPKHGHAEPIIISPPEPNIEEEQEDLTDETVSLFHDEMSDSDDETMGVFSKREEDTKQDRDKTMGVWAQPESETQPVPKPKKPPKKWIIATVAALLVVCVAVVTANSTNKPSIPQTTARVYQNGNSSSTRVPTISDQSAQAPKKDDSVSSPTVSSAPEQTEVNNADISKSKPSIDDLTAFPDKIIYPKEDSYLPDYETMYVKSSKGDSIYVFWQSPGDMDSRRSYYLYEQDAVTVIARENDFSCVIFTAKNGEQHIGWVLTDFLVYEYWN